MGDDHADVIHTRRRGRAIDLAGGPDRIDTFNPTDVRAIQKTLKAKGLALSVEADESTTGPAHIVLTDPDGNGILIDQH